MQGPVRVAGPANALPQIFLPDPNVITMAVQQARIADLEARLQEIAAAVQQARIADLARLQERETP
jgi:endonuclease/exonuclease/phosphatase family metal-dependent hydrolase